MAIDPGKYRPGIPEEIKGFLKQFGKSYGLGLIKPKLFLPDARAMEDEQGIYLLDADKTSVFGLPVFDIVQFDPVSYTDENGAEINIGAPLTLDIAIIEINQAKNIVKTARSGKNGTIKEYMGLGDYNINIKGWLVNPIATANPDILTREFQAYMKAPTDLKINSTFLSYFDIYNVVIESYRVSQLTSQRNVFEYEINCSDESPFEIKYSQERSIAMF